VRRSAAREVTADVAVGAAVAVEVGAAESLDWADIYALLARTPMSARVPLAVERAGDPAAAWPALGGEPLSLVARAGGRVVGFVHGLLAARHVDPGDARAVETLLYFGDLRVDAGARRLGVARRLLDRLATLARARGVRRGYCLTNEGNDAMLRLLEAPGARLRGRRSRTFTTASLWAPPRAAALAEVPLPAAAALEPLAARWRGSFLGPAVDGAGLAAWAAGARGLRWLRDPAGAHLALWDQAGFRRLRVLDRPLPLRLGGALLDAATPLTGGRRLPAPGAAFRIAEIALAAAALDGAWRGAARSAFAAGCHLVNVVERGLDPAEPRLPLPLWALRTRTHVVGFGIDGAPPLVCPPAARVWVDLGML
jgi:ribosomal protein S18 acetylase RimI-like enzyme